MKSMIARKKRQFANRYKVIHGKQPFKFNMILNGDKKKKLTDNCYDPLYSINFNDCKYVIKHISNYGEDEWNVIVKIITRNLKCPLMIDYYACIRSILNHKRYIMMRHADTDLKDYLTDNGIQADRKFVDRLLNFVFQFQVWCITNLKLIYKDLKCRNILLLYRNELKTDYEFRMTDMGLMEKAHIEYDLDEKMLNDNGIVNFMFPRRDCTNQQMALFAMTMLIFEVLVMHMKTTEPNNASTDNTFEDNASTDNTFEDNASTDNASTDNTFEDNASTDNASTDNALADNASIDNLIVGIPLNDTSEIIVDNSLSKVDEEIILKDIENLTLNNSSVNTLLTEEESDKDDTEESESDADESDTDNGDDKEFIGLLDGRPTDDNLGLVLSKLPLFKEGENEDLLNFLKDLLDFKYDTIEEAYNIFKTLK
jgi:hypothetical protein